MKKYRKYLLIMIIILITIVFYYFKNTTTYSEIVKIFSSREALARYVSGFRREGPVIFFIIQVIQVIISPIPGSVTTIVGGSLFGLASGFLLNTASIFLGSIIAFLLAKTYGKAIVIRLVGDEKYNRYYKRFTSQYSVFLLALFLLPFFPDDLFCLLAGLSPMSFWIFIIILAFGRTPVIFIQTLVGAGLIEFDLTGWILMGVIALIVLLLVIRYKEKWEGWFLEKMEEG